MEALFGFSMVLPTVLFLVDDHCAISRLVVTSSEGPLGCDSFSGFVVSGFFDSFYENLPGMNFLLKCDVLLLRLDLWSCMSRALFDLIRKYQTISHTGSD